MIRFPDSEWPTSRPAFYHRPALSTRAAQPASARDKLFAMAPRHSCSVIFRPLLKPPVSVSTAVPHHWPIHERGSSDYRGESPSRPPGCRTSRAQQLPVARTSTHAAVAPQPLHPRWRRPSSGRPDWRNPHSPSSDPALSWRMADRCPSVSRRQSTLASSTRG